MSNFLLLLSVVLCVTTGSTYAQEKPQTITVSLYKEPLDKAVEKVARQGGYSVWGRISKDITCTIDLVGMPIDKALDTLLRSFNYWWKFQGSIVYVTRNELNGKISNKAREPVVGASIAIKGIRGLTTSDDSGKFTLYYKDTSDILEVTFIGFKRLTREIGSQRSIDIQLEDSATTLSDVSVKGKKPKSVVVDSTVISIMGTGSVTKISNVAFNISTSFNILDRLDGNVSGVTMPENILPNQNQSTVNIRSRSTLEGNVQPLTLLNGIPYCSRSSNLNNDDIEQVDVLKDAASTSIGGVHAGNGVISIKSKTGSYNKPLSVTTNVWLSIGKRPNLFHLPLMSSTDYIDAEQALFISGIRNNIILNSAYEYLPPAMEAMNKNRMGLMDRRTLDSTLNSLRNSDVRNDAKKYMYKGSLDQHYHIGIAGGSDKQHYYGSVGYDKHSSALVGDAFKRFTGNLNNTFAFGKQQSEVNVSVYYSRTETDNNGIGIGSLRTLYERLKDDNGRVLSQARGFRRQYVDTAGGGQLFDWHYRLLEELALNDNSTICNALHATVGVNYKFWKGFAVNLTYRHEFEEIGSQNLHAEGSYFTRDLNNRYSKIENGVLTRVLPSGGILDRNTITNMVNNLNGRITYTYATTTSAWDVYAGREIRHIRSSNIVTRNYGYKDANSQASVDYLTRYPLYYEPLLDQPIPYIDDKTDTTLHFYSSYFNGAYTYKGRYAVNITARKDESNIFGVKANQKGVPLWSVGAAWEISQEPFFRSGFVSQFKVRVSHGYCGNISRSVSALATALTVNNNNYGAPVGVIVNPPNPSLQWERIGISNLGIDFSLMKDRISGSVEGYFKTGKYLFGLKPVDPTNGVILFNGNVAAMKGGGIDVTINSKIIKGKQFQWSNMLLASFVKDKVTDYKVRPPAIAYYCDPETLNPLEGFPLYAISAFGSKGLDPLTGDPIGYLNGHESKDYSAIINSTDLSNLIYYGSATPTFFGSFRNTFWWKKLALSFNISWKAGYYFRRNSIRYTDLMNGGAAGHADFSKRWRRPGDEAFTNVPSFVPGANVARDIFYAYSAPLVERGDHIRLKDVRLSYIIGGHTFKKSVKPTYEFFIYGLDLGILYRANDQGIDPDALYDLPNQRNITLGVKVNF